MKVYVVFNDNGWDGMSEPHAVFYKEENAQQHIKKESERMLEFCRKQGYTLYYCWEQMPYYSESNLNKMYHIRYECLEVEDL